MLVQLSRSWVCVPTHRSACAAAGTATRRAFAPMENVVHAGSMPAHAQFLELLKVSLAFPLEVITSPCTAPWPSRTFSPASLRAQVEGGGTASCRRLQEAPAGGSSPEKRAAGPPWLPSAAPRGRLPRGREPPVAGAGQERRWARRVLWGRGSRPVALVRGSLAL